MSSFSLFHWFILFAIVAGIYLMFRSGQAHGDPVYCRACGHRGPSATRTRGHIALEIILWLCFLVPGIIYSVWRLTTRGPVCSRCGSDQVIPADAPAAAGIMRSPSTSQGETKICPFCAESIKSAAIVCKHCGKDLPHAPEPEINADALDVLVKTGQIKRPS